MKYLPITIITVFLLGFSISKAQDFDINTPIIENDFQESLLVSLTPEYPAPLTEVNIRVDNYLIDLDRSIIQWEIDGVIVAEEVGKRTHTITTKQAGVPTEVIVRAVATNNEEVVGSIRVQPGSVDVVWEAQVYTPPFYKGKALNTSESQVNLVAYPHLRNEDGRLLSVNEVIFEWETEKGVDINASGIGKNVYKTTSDKVYSPRTILVRASSFDGSQTVEKMVDLSIHKPEILLYRESGLSGVMFNEALPVNLSVNEEEITFFTAPFFFSTGIPNSDAMIYQWNVGGRIFEENSNRITLRRDGEGGGSSYVEVSIERAGKYFQKGVKAINVSF